MEIKMNIHQTLFVEYCWIQELLMEDKIRKMKQEAEYLNKIK